MARNFVRASAQRINTVFPNLTSSITVSCYFKHSGSVGTGYPNRQIYLSRDSGNLINYTLFANANYIELVWTSSMNTYHSLIINHVADNNWHYMALSHTWGITSSTNCYIDGIKKTLGTIPTSLVNNITSPTSQSIGNRDTASEAMNGDIAAVAIYNTALSERGLNSLSQGFSPQNIRPQSLLFYAPLVRELTDLKGATLTNVNSTVANHPRVYA